MAELRTTSLLLSCRAYGGVFWTKDTRQELCDEWHDLRKDKKDLPDNNRYIDMKSADGTYVVGWLASQTDMLAEDWEIVRPVPYKDEVHIR